MVRLRKARYCGIAPVLILRLPRSFEFLFRNPGLNRQPCPGDDGFVPRGLGREYAEVAMAMAMAMAPRCRD